MSSSSHGRKRGRADSTPSRKNEENGKVTAAWIEEMIKKSKRYISSLRGDYGRNRGGSSSWQMVPQTMGNSSAAASTANNNVEFDERTMALEATLHYVPQTGAYTWRPVFRPKGDPPFTDRERYIFPGDPRHYLSPGDVPPDFYDFDNGDDYDDDNERNHDGPSSSQVVPSTMGNSSIISASSTAKINVKFDERNGWPPKILFREKQRHYSTLGDAPPDFYDFDNDDDSERNHDGPSSSQVVPSTMGNSSIISATSTAKINVKFDERNGRPPNILFWDEDYLNLSNLRADFFEYGNERNHDGAEINVKIDEKWVHPLTKQEQYVFREFNVTGNTKTPRIARVVGVQRKNPTGGISSDDRAASQPLDSTPGGSAQQT